jgi:hypothetical protein
MKRVAMPLGLNDIMRDFLHKFSNVYLDNVCVYIRTRDEHLEHMRHVLQHVKEEGLKLRLEKCFSGLQEMEYLGCTVCLYMFYFDKESRGRGRLASVYDVEGVSQFCTILQFLRQVHPSF